MASLTNGEEVSTGQNEGKLPTNQYDTLDEAIMAAKEYMKTAIEIDGELKDSEVLNVYKIPGKNGDPDRFLASHSYWIDEARNEDTELEMAWHP